MRAYEMTRPLPLLLPLALALALALPATSFSQEEDRAPITDSAGEEAEPSQPGTEPAGAEQADAVQEAGAEPAEAERPDAAQEAVAEHAAVTEEPDVVATEAEPAEAEHADATDEPEAEPAEAEHADATDEPEADVEAEAVAAEDGEVEVDAEAAIDELEAEELVDPDMEETVALEEPLPPTRLTAFDTPNSAGDSITLQWVPAPNEDEAGIVRYEVMRSQSPDGPWELAADLTRGAMGTRDSMRIETGETYYYMVVSVTLDEQRAESEIVSAIPEAQWFHRGRWFILLLGLLVCGAILFNIARARRGEELYVRRIAGLESVEEAIGRSTEMGKPVLYVPGIRDMDDIQTIASMSILSHVAKLTAEYDTPILVPNTRAVVMSTAQEVVKQAYLDAGRPDAYNVENIRYLTDDQFGYVAGVDGIMIRDKPAANFFLGAFFAESLILAETGASTGAIQVAGTAMPSQLPFFVAACDYTLIGEELFAASAYLSREPQNLGSLKGQDWGKLVFMIAIVLGGIGATTAAWHVHVDSPAAYEQFIEARGIPDTDAEALEAALQAEIGSLRAEVMDEKGLDPEEEIEPDERAAVENETMVRFEQRFGASPSQIRTAPSVRAFLAAQPEELSTIDTLPEALRQSWILVRDRLEQEGEFEGLRPYERDEKINETFEEKLQEEFGASEAQLRSAVRKRRFDPDSWWNLASWWRSE